MFLSFIIPCYNESCRIQAAVEQLSFFFARFPHAYEIIFVDDGSSDNTAALIAQHISNWKEAQLHSSALNHGKGYAIQQGLKIARGDVSFFMDADLATDLSHVYTFLEHTDNDLVIGHRSHALVRRTRQRKILGRFASFFTQRLLKLPFVDTQCGFKMMGPKAKELALSCRSQRREFDIELLFLSLKNKLSIKELPVVRSEQKHSHVKLRDYFFTLFLVTKIKHRMHKESRER